MDQRQQRPGSPARAVPACSAGRSAGRLVLLALAVSACASVAGCSASADASSTGATAVQQRTYRVVLQGPVPLGAAPLAAVLPVHGPFVDSAAAAVVAAPAAAPLVAAPPPAAAPVAAAPVTASRVAGPRVERPAAQAAAVVEAQAVSPADDAQIGDAAVLTAPADAERAPAMPFRAQAVEPAAAEPVETEPVETQPADPSARTEAVDPSSGAAGLVVPLPPGAPTQPSGSWAEGAAQVVGAPPVLPDVPTPRGRQMSRNPFAPPGTPGALRKARPAEVAAGTELLGPVPAGRTPLRQAPGRTVRIGPVPVLPGSPRTDGTAPAVEADVLVQGASGDGVRQVQQLLVRHGWTGRVDGVFGPQTGLAVESFQRRRGLAVDGIVGRQTWAALRGRDGES